MWNNTYFRCNAVCYNGIFSICFCTISGIKNSFFCDCYNLDFIFVGKRKVQFYSKVFCARADKCGARSSLRNIETLRPYNRVHLKRKHLVDFKHSFMFEIARCFLIPHILLESFLHIGYKCYIKTK